MDGFINCESCSNYIYDELYDDYQCAVAMDMDEDESPLSMKADFLLSLCELVVGGKDGLQPIEKTVIDRCVRLIYRDMALRIGDSKPPLLQDLYEELLKQPPAA